MNTLLSIINFIGVVLFVKFIGMVVYGIYSRKLPGEDQTLRMTGIATGVLIFLGQYLGRFSWIFGLVFFAVGLVSIFYFLHLLTDDTNDSQNRALWLIAFVDLIILIGYVMASGVMLEALVLVGLLMVAGYLGRISLSSSSST